MLTRSAALEAVLFVSGEPLDKKEIAKLLDLSVEELPAAVGELETGLKGRGLSLVETDSTLELRTVPEAADLLKKIREAELSRDLGKASLETLAVVAYQEGATRSEIDWVRGVNSSGSVRTLLLRGLIEGREDEADKRRVRYVLTSEALAHLGVARLSDLPRHAELSLAAKTVVENQAALRETTD